MALKTGVAEAQKYLIQTNPVFSGAVQPALRELDKTFWAPALFEQVLAIKQVGQAHQVVVLGAVPAAGYDRAAAGTAERTGSPWKNRFPPTQCRRRNVLR
jgi:hypothetical protein